MRRSTTRILALATLLGLLGGVPGAARALSIIQPGHDLLVTLPLSFFLFEPPIPNPQIVELEGLPIGPIDIGPGIGIIDPGLGDTIIERLGAADLGSGLDTIDIEIVALSLTSVDPVDLGFGAGLEDIFITLNTSSPSVQSQMTITDAGEGEPHGTFDTILNLSFDVTGSVGGFYTTLEKTLTSSGNAWQHAPTGGPVIDGVNHLLNGSDESGDFWLSGIALHDDGSGNALHAVKPVPEPGTALLLALGLAGLTRRSGPRRSRRAPTAGGRATV